MTRQAFTHQGLSLGLEPLTDAQGPLRLVWLHGWGQSPESLRPLAHRLLPMGESWLLELPGHGSLPPPTVPAGPAELARLLHAWLASLPPCPTVLLGHSVGFRIILHAAAQNPGPLLGLVALAGAGVPRQRTLWQRLRLALVRALIRLAHGLKPYLGEGLLNGLRQRFGSADYRQCPAPLRPMFLAMVRDDASALLPGIATPTLLLYGSADEDTPPNVGARFARGLPQATLHLLPHLNHYTVLTRGQHQVAHLVQSWLKTLRA